MNHAAANVKYRSQGFDDLINGLLNLLRVCLRVWTISGQTNWRTSCLFVTQRSDLRTHVFGNVDDHGARSTSACNIESLMDDFSKFVHITYQVVMFGAGPGDTDRINFLKRIGADQFSRHLTGDH